MRNMIAELMKVRPEEITNLSVLKKGMTNRSFLFTCKAEEYIIRIPGEGTDKMINRAYEAAVYDKIAQENIGDDIIYINPQFGYKITKFWDKARVCDPYSENDIRLCMGRLRAFHQRKLQVEHEFNIWEQMRFYESLWKGNPSIYQDYEVTRQNVLSLRRFIDDHTEDKVLTHIDAVPDNFLFIKNQDGSEDIKLIDWEYAGMQDPHVDIAMFCIYAMYNLEQVDRLIDLYFTEGCTFEIRVKIYCYIAICGLLWSNWCEYKKQMGVEFGKYAAAQYQFAKDYYQIVKERLE